MNEKPITVKREEMLAQIYAAINQAEVPAFVVEDALRRLLADVEQMARQQFAQDYETYMAEEAHEETKEEKEG